MYVYIDRPVIINLTADESDDHVIYMYHVQSYTAVYSYTLLICDPPQQNVIPPTQSWREPAQDSVHDFDTDSNPISTV